MKRKIIIAGGSGFLGTALAQKFTARGDEVFVLTREPQNRIDGAKDIAWDARTLGDWATLLDGADVVLNLTGKSVDCRYTEKNRHLIIASRVDSTRVVGEAIARCKNPPRVWLNASSATLYQHDPAQPADESGPTGATAEAKDEFSIEVIRQWERALEEAPTPRTRKVPLRITLVFGESSGVFPVLRRLARFGLGGKMGTGRQFVSWIHEEDFCRAAEWIIEHDDLIGPVNLAAPNPLPNAEMMRLVRKECGAPFGLPATEWMLEIGAFFLRTETELIIKSRRVVPGKLSTSGFQFHFPNLKMHCETSSTKNTAERIADSNEAARRRLLSVRGEPLFVADWLRPVFIHFAVPAAALQRDVPFQLDLFHGQAHVSLVAFTMRRMRPFRGGTLTAWMLKPIANNDFLNVRTYVQHLGEPGIYFLTEWMNNPISVHLGPFTFGLPYRFGEINYQHQHEEKILSGTVREAVPGPTLNYEAHLTEPKFTPCPVGSLDEFLLERYTAFTAHKTSRRFFRIWHEPWKQQSIRISVNDLRLLETVWPWFADATLAGANYSPGAHNVWMGRPHRIKD